MSALDGVLEIRGPLRPCMVDDKKALFHQWSHKAQVVGPSLAIGGHGGGQLEQTVAIVEYEDGTVAEVYPYRVRFLDTQGRMEDFQREYLGKVEVKLPSGEEMSKAVVEDLKRVNGDG